jgi:hypothetical protein
LFIQGQRFNAVACHAAPAIQTGLPLEPLMRLIPRHWLCAARWHLYAPTVSQRGNWRWYSSFILASTLFFWAQSDRRPDWRCCCFISVFRGDPRRGALILLISMDSDLHRHPLLLLDSCSVDLRTETSTSPSATSSLLRPAGHWPADLQPAGEC